MCAILLQMVMEMLRWVVRASKRRSRMERKRRKMLEMKKARLRPEMLPKTKMEVMMIVKMMKKRTTAASRCISN